MNPHNPREIARLYLTIEDPRIRAFLNLGDDENVCDIKDTTLIDHEEFEENTDTEELNSLYNSNGI